MLRRSILALLVTGVLTPAVAAADTLRIGFINTFSGGAAVYGKHQKDGLELALAHLGGKIGGLETEIIYGDDQQKADVGHQVAEKMLTKDKVHFVTGITWSHVLLAVQKPVTEAKVFLISTNAGASPMAGKLCNPYFFSTSWNNDQTPEAMGKLIQDEGIDNVFMMAPNYQAGKDMLAGFQRYYKRTVKGQILTKLGQTDYQAEISQVRAANPSAVFIFLPGPMGIAFIKQWAAAGLGSSTKLYTVFTVDYLTLPALGDAAVGTYHTSYWSPDLDFPANKRFVKAFQEKYGYMPSQFSAQAYDMPLLLDSAIRAVKGNLADKDGIRNALRRADFESVRGPFKYNVNHIPIQNFYKREVVRGPDGKPAIVSRGAVFTAHKDSYYQQCPMKW
jgi:branched-chain amino acid transport system substrate-binding protein